MSPRRLAVPVSALVVELVVWNPNTAGTGDAGASPQESAAGPLLTMVAKAVAVLPTCTDRLDGSLKTLEEVVEQVG